MYRESFQVGPGLSLAFSTSRWLPALMIFALGLAISTCVFVGPGLAQEPAAENGQDAAGDFGQPPDSVFLAAPRDLVRPLLRAQRAIEEGETDRAVDLIGSFLAEAPAEDYLVPVPGRPGVSTSLLRRAESMLASLPGSAMEGYRLRFGVLAQQRLDRAIQDRSMEALADLR